MIFSVEEAFKQLEQRGRVTSARSSAREEGSEVWVRKTQTGEKEFEAVITNVEKIEWIDKKNLIGHLHDHDLTCGFKSAVQWVKKIDELHDEIPNPIYVHTVERKTKAPHDLRREVRGLEEC
jgi:DNA-binding MarR family transcriptional regulator